ncbi:MAG: hypothetical protein C0501_17040 [Isosphaera sp.]|nr:hypothetical protein [Isosphaera sp.]
MTPTPTTTTGWLALVWGAGVVLLLVAWAANTTRVNLSHGSLNLLHTFSQNLSAGPAFFLWPLALAAVIGYGAYLGVRCLTRALRRAGG